MNTSRRIAVGIVGDYNAEYTAHLATDAALVHAAAASGIAVEPRWLSTEALAGRAERALADVDGVLCAPGVPYASMDGALQAIRYARENDVPLLATCGGFQYMAIEYARSVLGWSRLARLYGERQPSEAYLSSFGLNPAHAADLAAAGLRLAGWGPDGEVRAIEVAEHPFYLGVLFIPQLSSSSGSPHPLIVGLLEAAAVAGDSGTTGRPNRDRGRTAAS